MKRKIVQIAVALEPGEQPATIALADDGTLWHGWNHYIGKGIPSEFRWEQIPGLPDNNSNLTKVR